MSRPEKQYWEDGNTYRPKKKKLTVDERQAWAIILKVEEKLNNSQIARMVSDKYGPISPAAVGKWWTRPHIKREIKRHQERYNDELMPAIALEWRELLVKSMKEMNQRVLDSKSRLSEVTAVAKLAGERLDIAVGEIREDDENANAKEVTDNILKHLTVSGKKKLAEHYAFGTEIELTEDDVLGDVIEAEVVSDEQPNRSLTAGDNKEPGA